MYLLFFLQNKPNIWIKFYNEPGYQNLFIYSNENDDGNGKAQLYTATPSVAINRMDEIVKDGQAIGNSKFLKKLELDSIESLRIDNKLASVIRGK